MIIAIASGKGGTGKTTLTTALALAASQPCQLLDCDVEEPNSHFFIHPASLLESRITDRIPAIDETRCTGCGKCAELCQFSAITVLNKKPLFFAEMCHSCGGCMQICPMQAITEIDRQIGTLTQGTFEHIHFVSGSMKVGHAMSPPVIRAVKALIRPDILTLIDCPPGTSCPCVTAAKGADGVILITEPTPFGLHDLKLAVETMQKLALPVAVLVNRAIEMENCISVYCTEAAIPLLLQIPENRAIAAAYSKGIPLTESMPELKDQLAAIPLKLKELFS
jgi:MinD superfamily P-loop ATPase